VTTASTSARGSWEWPLSRPEKQARVVVMNENIVQSNYSILRQHLAGVHRRWSEQRNRCEVGTLDWPLSMVERRSLAGKRERDTILVEHLELLEKIGALHRDGHAS